MNLDDLEPLVLMKLHRDIITELERQDIVRTRNQPIAGYARWLIKDIYNLYDVKNPSDKYDFYDKAGKKYIIRSRQIREGKNKNVPFSVIRNIEERNFDFLITVVFDMNFEIIQAYKIKIEALLAQNHHNTHQNGYVLKPSDIDAFKSGVEDIRNKFTK